MSIATYCQQEEHHKHMVTQEVSLSHYCSQEDHTVCSDQSAQPLTKMAHQFLLSDMIQHRAQLGSDNN